MAKKLTETQAKVLEIISGQHDAYLIQPHATAFLLEGLEPGEVEDALKELYESGHVEHLVEEQVEPQLVPQYDEETVTRLDAGGEEESFTYTVPRLDAEGNHIHEVEDVAVLGEGDEPVVVAHGYRISEKGKNSLAS